MTAVPDLLLSCWVVEAARSAVLSGRGHGDASIRAAERARILAGAIAASGSRIVPRYASEQAEWQAEVAGSQAETGAIGWFFLQRLGMYVDSHAAGYMSDRERSRMAELLAPDAEEVNRALTTQPLPPSPPPEWPEATPALPAGEVISRFAILGDPHIGLKASAPLVAAAIDDINRLGVDFVVVIGDLTQDGSVDFFKTALSTFERFEMPVHLTVGNHDMWGGKTEEVAVGLDRFREIFEIEPFGEYLHDSVRAILLNSADPTASPFPPFDLLSGSFTNRAHESVPGGTYDEKTLTFARSLDPAGTTFVFQHHPPFPYLGFPPLVFGLDGPSTDELATLSERISPKAIFCGHTHRSAISGLGDVPVIEVPSIKEWPFGFGLVEVGQQGWAYNLIPLSDQSLVKSASENAGLLFRRYGRGPDVSRAFSASL